MEYTIKITGSGTKEEIAKELRHIADAIFHPTSMGHGLNLCIDDVEWESATLMTEIQVIEGSDDIPENLYTSPKAQ